jgi:hypothetical protein
MLRCEEQNKYTVSKISLIVHDYQIVTMRAKIFLPDIMLSAHRAFIL